MPHRPLVRAVLARHGRTFGQQLGFDVTKDTPSPLFRMLCFSLLASARIGHRIALDAARALSDAGWTTASRMAASTWEDRVGVLNRARYARYDESTSRMLGDTCALLLDRYHGDLRRLRAAAPGDPSGQRRLLQECKGIGEVGADIFFREVQAAWEEHYPFVDPVALRAAERLGLPTDPHELARIVDRSDLPRLVCGLVSIELEGSYDTLKAAAP